LISKRETFERGHPPIKFSALENAVRLSGIFRLALKFLK